MALLPPVPYRTPMLVHGLVSRPWQQWFEALLARAGGPGDIDLTESPIVSQTLPLIVSALERIAALEMQGGLRVPLPVASEEILSGALPPSLAAFDVLAQRVAALELRPASLLARLEALAQRIESLEIAQIFQ